MNAKPALVRPCFASDFDWQAALWTARLSTSFSEPIYQINDGMYSEELRQLIGIAPREGRLSKTELKTLMKSCAEEISKLAPRKATVAVRNVSMLGDLIGLDSLQKEILLFAAVVHQHPVLAEVVESIRTTSLDAIIKLLAIALSASPADVRRAIRTDGHLLTTQTVSIERSSSVKGLALDVPKGLLNALFATSENVEQLMSAFIEVAPRPKLTASAFAHLAQESDLLMGYLSKACSARLAGINLLIYGAPGTGKTEFVRWLAAQQGKRLYQVRATDNQGEPISGTDRLAFFQLSQRFLQKSDSLILFDELEDVFPADNDLVSLFNTRRSAPGKMFINRLLETNPVPTLWISNKVEHIDKAYLRRFDFSFEMGIPPIGVRRKILNKYLRHQSISEETINYLAQQEELSPAQIEKAAKILSVSNRKLADRESTLLLVVENSQTLLEQAKNEATLNFAECSYQIDYLNADCDLQNLVTQLKRVPGSAGAICFYGPPGSGKTAFAHYIAQEVELPLITRRASDILRSYVGETEQKIAEMFRVAKQSGAILLLDEADSFLSERTGAQKSWEITAVNEMLTQMERFDGLFICSTNLIQRLDTASLRRFALKIKFDYMTAEQRWRLFCEQAKKFPRARESGFRSALNKITNLTPGDFATVRRQASLMSITLTADELLKRLKQESVNKTDRGKRPIGFVTEH